MEKYWEVKTSYDNVEKAEKDSFIAGFTGGVICSMIVSFILYILFV